MSELNFKRFNAFLASSPRLFLPSFHTLASESLDSSSDFSDASDDGEVAGDSLQFDQSVNGNLRRLATSISDARSSLDFNCCAVTTLSPQGRLRGRLIT